MYTLIKNDIVVQFPYSLLQLRKDNPDVSFPRIPSKEILESFGVYEVQPTDKPVYDITTQNILEGIPELIDDVWVQTWVIENISDEEIAQREQDAWEMMRSQRNTLLSESDWTQLSDAPINKEAWQLYRQQLRDLPQNTADPFNVIWPEIP